MRTTAAVAVVPPLAMVFDVIVILGLEVSCSTVVENEAVASVLVTDAVTVMSSASDTPLPVFPAAS